MLPASLVDIRLWHVVDVNVSSSNKDGGRMKEVSTTGAPATKRLLSQRFLQYRRRLVAGPVHHSVIHKWSTVCIHSTLHLYDGR